MPVPLNAVTSVTIDSDQLLFRPGQMREEPYPVYIFGEGRKRFMSNFQPEGVYGKPFPHAPDPDLNP